MTTPPKDHVILDEYFDLGGKLETAIHTFDKYMDPTTGIGTVTDEAAQRALVDINTAFAQMNSGWLSNCNLTLIRRIPIKLLQYAKDNTDDPSKQQLIHTIAETTSTTPFLKKQLHVIYISLTASPLQPTADELLIATDWLEFAAAYYSIMPGPITTALKGLIHTIPDSGNHERVLAIATRIRDLYIPVEVPVQDEASDDDGKSKALDTSETQLPPELALQLHTINDSCARFLEHYLLQPFSADADQRVLTHDDTTEFKTNLARISHLIFCSEPRLSSRLEKRCAIATMEALTAFFKDIDRLKSTPLSSGEYLPRFAGLMKQRFAGLREAGINNLTILRLIRQKVQSILAFALLPQREQAGAVSAISSNLLLLLSNAICNFLNHMIRPDIIPFFIQRLSLQKLTQLVEHYKQDSSTSSNADDIHFSRQIGARTTELINQFLSLGQAGGAAGLMLEALKAILEQNAGKIGVSVQEFLNNITSTRLMLAPFYIADTLLFDYADDGTPIPTLRQHLSRTDHEKEEFRALTQKQFYDLLHPLICTIAQSYNSQRSESWLKRKAEKIGKKLITKDSTKAYCNSLGNILWQISQKPELIRILIFYVLNGVSSAILVEKQERQRERHIADGVSTS